VLNDTIIFSEWGRIQYFSLEGKYKKTAVIPSNLKAGTFISEDEFMSAPSAIRGYRLEKKKAKMMLYNLKDQSEKLITEFYPYEKATASTNSGGGRASVRVIIHSITPMVFVTYRDGKIYYGMSDAYKINVIDLKGTEICSFSVDGRKQKEVPETFKKELAKGLGDVPADLIKKIIDGLPEKASFFQDIKVDKNGLIYVLVSDPGNEASQVIDIFSPQGKYLYTSELRIEEGLSLNAFFLIDDNLFLAEEDGEGNLKAAKYLINLPVL
jgi:outer membrane protein assembly factor BamB